MDRPISVLRPLWFPCFTWRLSNTLDSDFCVEALEDALAHHERPESFNTDRGAQFTGVLKGAAVAISMHGKGRWVDNVFVERLWRNVKYEEVYLHAYESVAAARAGLGRSFRFYHAERRHRGPWAPDTRCGVC